MGCGRAVRGAPAKPLDLARRHAALWLVVVLAAAGSCWWLLRPLRGEQTVLVVAYDASRDYLTAIGAALPDATSDGATRLSALHAGSVRQAESLAHGLVADVVLLASPVALDHVVSRTGCLPADWQRLHPHGSSPVYSTIVLLVRRGNPLGIGGWDDLYRREVRTVLPDPRASGAGRYAYLALMAEALERHDERLAAARVRDLMMRARLIRLGAHAAFEVFDRDGRGDVLLTWESEALRITRLARPGAYEVVYPASSILAEPVVAVLGCMVERRGSAAAAGEVIEFLFSGRGQAIAAHAGLRPRDAEAMAALKQPFAALELQPVGEVFGDWERAWRDHLGPEGTFAYAMELRAALAGGVE
jgi:sulfate/thiosulfate transport system substrate-binding protein